MSAAVPLAFIGPPRLQVGGSLSSEIRLNYFANQVQYKKWTQNWKRDVSLTVSRAASNMHVAPRDG